MGIHHLFELLAAFEKGQLLGPDLDRFGSAGVKLTYADRLTFWGGIDTQHVLQAVQELEVYPIT